MNKFMKVILAMTIIANAVLVMLPGIINPIAEQVEELEPMTPQTILLGVFDPIILVIIGVIWLLSRDKKADKAVEDKESKEL